MNYSVALELVRAVFVAAETRGPAAVLAHLSSLHQHDPKHIHPERETYAGMRERMMADMDRQFYGDAPKAPTEFASDGTPIGVKRPYPGYPNLSMNAAAKDES